MQVGQLRSCGLAKETVVGTPVTTPTEYLRFYPPDSFYPAVEPLISGAVGSIPDKNIKQTPGPGKIEGLKGKFDLEPENCGQLLNALFGADTLAEDASFIVQTGVNDKINFTEDGGAELTATLAAGTYVMGASSAVAGSLCEQVKTQLEAAPSSVGTYTVTYSFTTKKMTITKDSGVFVLKWGTGANAALSARTLLGWSTADTSSAIAQTSSGTTTVAPFTHTFQRTAVAQLPTYTWWFDKAPLYPLFAGCMLNKVEIEAKAKELVTIDTEWVGLSYDESGSSKSPTYSPVRPFSSFMASIAVDGGPSLDYDNLKLSFMNNVKADHVIGSSRYPAKVYSEGFEVELSAELFFEDAVQYNKFLAGTTASFVVTLTHVDDVSGAATGEKYSFVVNVPSMVYKSANLPAPSGVLKVPFIATAMYDLSTTKTANVVLKNGVAASYS